MLSLSTGERLLDGNDGSKALGGYDHAVHIIASDLSTKVLQTAREGLYKADVVSKLSAQQVERFFLRSTEKQSGYMQVRPELQRMIDFRGINLLDGTGRLCALDAIFCRNVMIYFDKATQLAILRKFVPLLRSDGLLFAGHSESFYHASEIFRLRGQTVYELANKGR